MLSNGLKITRDPAGRIASVTYAPNRTVTYTYNNQGLLIQVADWVGGNTTFTYDPAAQLTSVAYANGVTQVNTWDADGRLASAVVSKGSVLSSITLTRDALGRVTSAARSAANIPVEAKGTEAQVYDVAGQLIGDTWDGLGRILSDALRTYTWDLASRLRSFTGATGSASFTYDALGQRLTRTSGGATQNFVWNYAFPQPVVSTVELGGADQTYYVWLPDGTLLNSISASDNTRRFYSFDESGSTVLLTDSTGAVTDTYAISVYGDTVTQTGSTANPFTFQGKQGTMQEGSGSLYYMLTRYYDSGPARFLSRDPVPPNGAATLNFYEFANPIEHSQAGSPFQGQTIANAAAPPAWTLTPGAGPASSGYLSLTTPPKLPAGPLPPGFIPNYLPDVDPPIEHRAGDGSATQGASSLTAATTGLSFESDTAVATVPLEEVVLTSLPVEQPQEARRPAEVVCGARSAGEPQEPPRLRSAVDFMVFTYIFVGGDIADLATRGSHPSPTCDAPDQAINLTQIDAESVVNDLGHPVVTR